MHLLAAFCVLLAAGQDVDEARLREWIGRLGGDFLDEREEARKALEAAGKPAEKLLIEALSQPDPRIRRGCLLLLVKIPSEAALPRAAALFRQDEDAGVVDAAFELFRTLGAKAEAELIGALAGGVAAQRRDALRSLREQKSAKAVEAADSLEEKDADPGVREEAYLLLLAAGPPAEDALLRRLDVPDEARRLRAYGGLKESKSPKAAAAAGARFGKERSTDCIDAAYDILRGAEAGAEPHFTAALQSPQERAREKAVDGLKALKAVGAIDAVAGLFRADPSEAVRKAAGEFLKAQGLKAEDALVASLAAKQPGVKLEAIRALAEIKSEKPLAEISRMFREEKDRETHRASFEYLRRAGARAERDLLFALGDEDKAGIRIPAIQALGAAKSEAAVEPLIDFLSGIDPETKEPARDALVRIGPKAHAAVEKAVQAGRLKRAAADQVRELADAEGVEAQLGALVTEAGGTGWYEGQFDDLIAFGKARATPVLLRMLKEPAFPWRHTERRESIQDYDRYLRELAAMALGEFGDPAVAGALKEALAEQPPGGAATSLREELTIALHRLGDRAPLEEFLAGSAGEVETLLKGGRTKDACSVLFSRGLVLNRVARRADAAAAYAKIVDVVAKAPPEGRDELSMLGNALYNLACLASLDGRKTEAVDWLSKAVREGFTDRDWIRRDKDLDAIRGEPGYRTLLADDALFEKADK